MRYIEDLRDIYKNKKDDVYDKNIWVIGCSPWLADYPADWFDDKISIRLNYSMVAFPLRTDYHYVHWYHSEWDAIMDDGEREKGIRHYVDEKVPEIYDRVILPVPHELVKKPGDYGKYHEKITWMRYNETLANKEDFQTAVRKILKDRVECEYRALSTVAHTGIQAALIMGAKRVILAGCECKTTANTADAQVRGMDEFNYWAGPKADKRRLFYIEGIKRPKELTTILPIEEQEGTSPRRMRHKNGTKWIAEEAILYDREIVRHSYKKGYEPVL